MDLEKIKFSDDLEEKSFKYSVKNGLLRYSKRFDRGQSIITASVSARGDWDIALAFQQKAF